MKRGRRIAIAAMVLASIPVAMVPAVAQQPQTPRFRILNSPFPRAGLDSVDILRQGTDISRARIIEDRQQPRRQPGIGDYPVPVIPSPGATAGPSQALRATEGRPDLNTINSGAFATSGPTAIGGSAVTRPSLAPRRQPSGRAVIRD